MSQHPDIDHLISVYLSGHASDSEKEELEQWLSISSDNREMLERLREIWTMSSSEEHSGDMEAVRDRIWAAGTKQKERVKVPAKRTIDLLYWTKIAAVFLLFLTGVWQYSLVQGHLSEPEKIAWAEKSNPAGQKSSHRLPDGTKVWLNAESSLRFPVEFSDTIRLVQLRGEAFFEVAKDQQKPFIVEAAGIHTEVLGTAFNIQAYPEDPQVKVALLEGKVRVHNESQVQIAVLSPGEELLAYKDNRTYSKQPFKYENTFGWKEGILVFDGADFTSFRKTIEKWYGVEVAVKGTAPDDWEIRARYQREDLKHILRDISFNKNIQFELQGKKVLFSF